MPDTLVEEKIERALQAVIQDAVSGIPDSQVYKGTDNQTKTVNYIICHCMAAAEDREVAGNWTVRARVGVFGDPDQQASEDVLANFNSQCGLVSDQLMMDNLGDLLSAEVAGLTVYDPPINRRKIPDIEGRKWVKWFELELYCLCIDA